jgi:hypothetical protein
MKRLSLAIVLTATLSLPAAADAPAGTVKDAAIKEAAIIASKSAVAELAELLKGALQTAIQETGPVGALDVCKVTAPKSSSAISEERRLKIKRTGPRVRNQDNAPDPFESRVLAYFQTQAESGADLQSLSYSEINEMGGVKTLRYMKAIPMIEQPCAICHGTNVKPDVARKIRQLYPQDRASGFKAGGLRGAFSVVAPLD